MGHQVSIEPTDHLYIDNGDAEERGDFPIPCPSILIDYIANPLRIPSITIKIIPGFTYRNSRFFSMVVSGPEGCSTFIAQAQSTTASQDRDVRQQNVITSSFNLSAPAAYTVYKLSW